MRDFYATTSSVPLDQAEGLRQLFSHRAGRARRVLALAANPHVECNATVLDRVAATLSCLGRQVLVVDAALSAPAPHELARLELAAGIEPMMPGVAYLPARGLPMSYVDTRGSAARFVEALFDAVPSADVVLLHAEAPELARLLARTAARPLLMAADHPESLKHAYAACKLLLQRTGLPTFDLLLAASANSPRIASIVASLRGCAESFLGALVHDWALVDPSLPTPLANEALEQAMAAEAGLAALAAEAADAADPAGPAYAIDSGFGPAGSPSARLAALLAAQLALDDDAAALHTLTPTPLHPGRALPTDR